MIELEIKNDRVTPALERLGAQLGDLTPAMRDIGEYLVASTKARFASGKAPEGEAWAPKSETTKAAYRRRRDRVDERPLFGPSGALSGNIYYEARPDRIEWGSPMIYAAVMQFGAKQGAFGRTSRNAPIPWGDIPARPFLGLSTGDEDEIVRIAAEWLEDGSAAA